MHPESFPLPETSQVTDPCCKPGPAGGIGDGTREPRTAPGSTGEQAGRCRARGRCWSPGRGEGAAQAIGSQRIGILAADTCRTGMLGRCSTTLVRPREHLRHWFHWSSGLLHPSLSFPPPWAFPRWMVIAPSPGSPKPSAHSRARAVEETSLMQHPNKQANWSILGSRGR